jgi:GNAT superfamily N-acetyltransferase
VRGGAYPPVPRRRSEISDNVRGAVRATGEKLVGLGQYIKIPNQPRAEVALLISDEWQRRGLGSWLTQYLVRIARQAGITGFEAEVLAVNRGMLAVFEALPYPLRMKLDSGTYFIAFDFSGSGSGAG